MSRVDPRARTEEGAPGSGDDPLALLLIFESGVTAIDAPRTGAVRIGRAEECELHLDDALASRHHATLFFDGQRCSVEDLASANGTRLAGARLPSGSRIPVEIGQTLEIGSSMIVLRRRQLTSDRVRRLLSHAELEVCLERECENARAQGVALAVVRLQIAGIREPSVIADLLSGATLVASYAPTELEVVLVGHDEARAAAFLKQLEVDARDLGGKIRGGIAVFPKHGRTADTLVAAAGRALGTSTEVATAQETVIEDSAMREIHRLLDRVAKSTISVLLLGETGVGKEVLAERLHEASRPGKPFIRINCAALSETLLESEIFGHEKGAFTGAESARVGLIEAADGGTVFFDEIGEVTSSIQAKLLRVLETRQVTRVGSVSARDVDVRFISATNRDLEKDAQAGRFRRDLFFRLNGFVLAIPPLRDRTSEIEPLTRKFLAEASAKLGLDETLELDTEALKLLMSYEWPGNIRELRNIVERAALLATDDCVRIEHLPADKLRTSWASSFAAPDVSSVSAPAASPDAERDRIQRALVACGGNQSRAAKALGISRRTLVTRLGDLGIPRPRKK